MTSKLQAALRAQKRLTEQVNQQIPGLLGLPLDGQRRVEVPNRQAFVFVRLRSNQSEVIQAYNNQVAPAYDLPVLVERNGGRYEVIGVDTASYENNWNSNAPFLPRHGNTHSFDIESGGGGDIVWVYPRQFMPALVLPSGSAGAENLIVSPYTLQNSDGTWKYVGNTGTANISQYRPSSPTGAIMGLVYLDAPSGNPYLLINSGTVFNNLLTGSSQVYPYIPTITNPSTQIPLLAVRLVTGTSSLSWDNIYDIRQFLHTTPTGSSGGAGGTTIGLGVMAQDEGVSLGTGTTLNFVGDNISASVSGSVVRVYVTGSAGGTLTVQENAVSQGSASILNFIGLTENILDASVSGSVARVAATPENGPQGFGYNYWIDDDLTSSGSVTVNLKTMASADPSPSNRLIFRIGDDRREVTSALSMTIPSGTNWCDLSSSKLVGRDTDLFVYLIWQTSGGGSVKMGISRIPYAKTMGDFVNTPTSEKYIAGNWTVFTASDQVEVIGRIRKHLLSSMVWFDTNPVTICKPIYKTDRLEYVPTWVGFTTQPGVVFNYIVDGSTVFVYCMASGDLTSNSVDTSATLPFTCATITGFLPRNSTSIKNNGTLATTPGMATITSADNKIIYYRDFAATAWTNTGTKQVYATEIYYPLE